MIIGYYTYGELSDQSANSIQKNGKVEGAAWYRKLYLNWLKEQGHSIVILNEKRKLWKPDIFWDSIRGSQMWGPSEFYKILSWRKRNNKAIDIERSWKWMHKNLNRVQFPKIDMLIIDNAGYPFFPIFTYKLMLMLAYSNRDIPILVLDDDDSTEPLFTRAEKVLGFNPAEKIWVATHFPKKLFPKQVYFPFPYDQSREKEILPVKELTHEYVYIGHDYNRREKIIEFYLKLADKINIEIYGFWDSWLQTKQSKKYSTLVFKGSIGQSAGFDLLNQSLASTIISPIAKHSEAQRITPRMCELSMAGTVSLADKDICLIDKYLLPDNILSADKIFERLQFLKTQSFKERRDMIEAQRKNLRVLTIDNIFANIFKSIGESRFLR